MILKPVTNCKPTIPRLVDSVDKLKEYFGGVGTTYIDFETTGLDMTCQ